MPKYIICFFFLSITSGFASSSELMEAIEAKENYKIHQLARKGADLNEKHKKYGGFRDMSPVVWAIKQDNLMGLSYLLRYGADPNSTGGFAHLPAISQVAQTSSLSTKTMLLMIDVLMKYGADIKATDKDGGTVLHSAAYSARPEVVEKYLEYGADKRLRDDEGKTAYELAEMFRHKNVLDLLRPESKFVKDNRFQDIEAYGNQASKLLPYTESN